MFEMECCVKFLRRISSVRIFSRASTRLQISNVCLCTKETTKFNSQKLYCKFDSFYHEFRSWGNKKRSVPVLVICTGLLYFLGLEEIEEESELIMTMKRGVLLTQRQEFSKAEQMFHIALRLAQQLQNHEAITYIYDLMANLAYDVGELDKAEKLFINVMQRIMATGAAEDDNRIIHMSLKIANICKMKQDYSKAEEGFDFCINALEKKVKDGTDDDDTLLLWGMALDWQAKYLLEQNQVDKAFDNFKKAYNMCVKVNGMEHSQTVILLNDLGTVSILKNDYDGAVKYFLDSIAIGKNIEDMQQSDLWSIYINLGFAYLGKKLYDEAKTACGTALRNAKRLEMLELENEANRCLSQIQDFLSKNTSK